MTNKKEQINVGSKVVMDGKTYAVLHVAIDARGTALVLFYEATGVTIHNVPAGMVSPAKGAK